MGCLEDVLSGLRYPMLLFLLVPCILPTNAYLRYQSFVPNGDRVPHPCDPEQSWTGLGHENKHGGGRRNVFGKQFADNNYRWTREFCEQDSDGDGLTNGQELGDPWCNWERNRIPDVTSGLSHPGICEPLNDVKCIGKNKWDVCRDVNFRCPAIMNPNVFIAHLTFPKTRVPTKETTYMCLNKELPRSDDYHIIATKPSIDNAAVMHHIAVFGCRPERDHLVSTTGSPYECDMVPNESCTEIIGLWSLGHLGTCYHNSAGIPIGPNGFRKVALQFHWTNPEKISTYMDGSGLDIFYTNRHRPSDAVILTVGQISMFIPKLVRRVFYSGSYCNNNTNTIYVTHVLHHMHRLGIHVFTEHFRTGVKLQTLAEDESYHYDAPVDYMMSTPVPILPGDQLRLTCVYDSSNLNRTVRFGDGTKDEMCFAFITSYPHINHTLVYSNRMFNYGCENITIRPGCNRFSYVNRGSLLGFKKADDTCAGLTNNSLNSGCSMECKAAMEPIRKHPCFEEKLLPHTRVLMQPSYNNIFTALNDENCRLTPMPGISTSSIVVQRVDTLKSHVHRSILNPSTLFIILSMSYLYLYLLPI